MKEVIPVVPGLSAGPLFPWTLQRDIKYTYAVHNWNTNGIMKGVIFNNIKRGRLKDSVPIIGKIIKVKRARLKDSVPKIGKIKIPVFNTQGVGGDAGDGGVDPWEPRRLKTLAFVVVGLSLQ
jgi:hypothetical protein